MSTRTDALLPPVVLDRSDRPDRRDRRARGMQAKEISVTAAPSTGRTARKRTSSWDPYEVWQTRVKKGGSE